MEGNSSIRPLVLLLLAVACYVPFVAGLGQKAIVSFDKGAVQLVGAPIHLSGNDWPGVIRAAGDLGADFGRVSGTNSSVIVTNSTSGHAVAGTVELNSTARLLHRAPASRVAIIVGTVGKSEIIDSLIKQRKIQVNEIKGKWESYQTQIVSNPISGVSKALVIAGSDKRGTIFAMYEISEQIGVSPWYWWADVATRQHSTIYAIDKKIVKGSPSIKYRGIFLNDEQPALNNWVRANWPDGKYGPGFHHDFYGHVFELLLRLKANFLWPTMWNSMFAVDDPLNQATADFYGIVMSTSHTEPLQVSTKEWNTLGNGPWDYPTNSKNIHDYWLKGVDRAKNYEGVWTIGMRGNGDNNLAGEVLTELLAKIITDQRGILKDRLGVQNISEVPQVWCLYKDIQAYYEAGMRVPEDVILLWTDDNWGNVRRLPTANETNQAGMYYHFDYVGDPRDYKWINTVSLVKTWEQLHLTYQRKARTIWIVNVGDLKPLELPIDYYMNLAYDFERWGTENRVLEYERAWAAREFGERDAKEIADLVDIYGFYAARRKYELVDPQTYSIIHYNEAERVLGEWKVLAERAEAVYNKLPANVKPSFFEIVYHPIKAAYIVYDIHISSGKNNLFANQRRSSANALAEHVLKRFKDHHNHAEAYHSLLGGKWKHQMDQTVLGYNYWQQPMRDTLPPLAWTQLVQSSLAGEMGVTVESSNGTVPGDDRYNVAEYNNNTLVLPTLDPHSPVQYRLIDIFSRGTKPFRWKASPHNPWVKVSPSSGYIDPADPSTDVRVKVSVDWDAVSPGYNIAFINITSDASYGNFGAPQVNLPVNKTSVPSSFHGFVESNQYISIEAESAQRNTTNGKVKYITIPRLGRTKSAVTLWPVLANTQNIQSGARLEYDLYTFTIPRYNTNITVYLAAALNQHPTRPLKYAIALDDATPQEIRYVPPPPDPLTSPVGWLKAVADGNTWKSMTNHTLTTTGKHTLKLWALEPGVVFQKVVVDLGGAKETYLGPPESKIV